MNVTHPVEISAEDLADELAHRLGVTASQCEVYRRLIDPQDAEPASRRAVRIAYQTRGAEGVKAVLLDQLREQRLRSGLSQALKGEREALERASRAVPVEPGPVLDASALLSKAGR